MSEPATAAAPSWRPVPGRAAQTRIAHFARAVETRSGVTDPLDYHGLWSWSVRQPADFWRAVWDFFAIDSPRPVGTVLDMPSGIESARWFPGTSVNFARHALRSGRDDGTAVIAVREDGHRSSLTWAELRRETAALARTLRDSGVVQGDRVVGYLPVGVPALVGLLATTAIGATWAQCGQDYGVSAAADRLAQLDPVVLLTTDGYRYNGRHHDRRADVVALQRLLPTVHTTIVETSELPEPDSGPRRIAWSDAVAGDHPLCFADVDFDHPLWVLFTSGTTGTPKGIVHGHGGVTIALLSYFALHADLGPDDVFLQYTSTNWMMWNVAVAVLLTGATTVLYDGSPTHPHTERLWEVAAETGATVVGTSPGYLQACENRGAHPGTTCDLSRLRMLNSTGAALPARAYHWVSQEISPTVQVCSTSGGTDVVGAFAGSAPTTPVWPGELSAPCLGVAVESWDADGVAHRDRVGELVVTTPMPSMPLRFWNDHDGSRLHDAYFATYPGVWRHGDWVTVTSHGSLILHGRSDATLNRHGVRLGSADIYAVVDPLDSVSECLVLGIEMPDGGYWMPMFVVPSGDALTEDDSTRIREVIGTQVSPRHVPDEIIPVPALPHTRTGKRIEVPLKRILQGASITDAVSIDAVDDASALHTLITIARSAMPGSCTGERSS